MKNTRLKFLLGLFIIAFLYISCKSSNEKEADFETSNFINFVDSITKLKEIDALPNWSTTNSIYEKKLNALNLTIDKLEDSKDYDEEIDLATEKFETYRKDILKNTKSESNDLKL